MYGNLSCHSGSPKANPEPMNANRQRDARHAASTALRKKPQLRAQSFATLFLSAAFIGSGFSPLASPGMTAGLRARAGAMAALRRDRHDALSYSL